MKSYIEKDPVLKTLEEKRIGSKDQMLKIGLYTAMRIIEDQATADVVKLTRCKDCKYYQKDEHFDFMICTHKDIPISTYENFPIDEPIFIPDETFYCPLGKRILE